VTRPSTCGYCPDENRAPAYGVFKMFHHIRTTHPEVLRGISSWGVGTLEGHFYATADDVTPIWGTGAQPEPQAQTATEEAGADIDLDGQDLEPGG
jgi:hypothetical protein